jgi:hypothetical protein
LLRDQQGFIGAPVQDVKILIRAMGIGHPGAEADLEVSFRKSVFLR